MAGRYSRHGRARPRPLLGLEIAKIVSGMLEACRMNGVPQWLLRQVVEGLRQVVQDPQCDFANADVTKFGDWAIPIAGMVGALVPWNSKAVLVDSLSFILDQWNELFEEPEPAPARGHRAN